MRMRLRRTEASDAEAANSTRLRAAADTVRVSASPPGTLRAMDTALPRGARAAERTRWEMTRGRTGRICTSFQRWISSQWAASDSLIRARRSSDMLSPFLSPVVTHQHYTVRASHEAVAPPRPLLCL